MISREELKKWSVTNHKSEALAKYFMTRERNRGPTDVRSIGLTLSSLGVKLSESDIIEELSKLSVFGIGVFITHPGRRPKYSWKVSPVLLGQMLTDKGSLREHISTELPYKATVKITRKGFVIESEIKDLPKVFTALNIKY